MTQACFDELADPLRQVTFVVVDLETTGGSNRTEAITEIGAVKVRGGEVLGEFSTLVDPGRSIPPQITMLTGISDVMVANAPRIESVLPSFLEFSRNCVLVAHNAGFDIGFLRAACQRQQLRWPNPRVVDTVRLARSVLTKDEAPSVRLGLLAPLLGSTVAPDHRALTDARATVDVLHALFERLGNLGVHSWTNCSTPPARYHQSAGANVCWHKGFRPPLGCICFVATTTRCSTSAPPRICGSGSVATSARPSSAAESGTW